jgi:recombination protein RecT
MATQISPVVEVRQTLAKMEDQLKSVLPSYISPEKFMQVVVTAVQLKPELLNLDRPSLYSSCLACASDGLIPDGREAALVPYKGKIAYQPMVGGLLKLIRNSGELATVDAQTVFTNDQYESYTDERGPHFKHVKARGERGAPVLTYGYAITKDGSVYHEEITEQEMHKIEACAKTKEVWGGAFRDEQYRKSAIKRLSKRLPKSTDIERVIDRDNEQYDISMAESTAEEAKNQTTSSALRDAVSGGVEEAQIVEQTVTKSQPAPTVVKTEPAKPSSNPVSLTCRGTIEDKKIKPFVSNGKAGNKYGVKIDGRWMGTFDSKIYDSIVEWGKASPPILLDAEYVESVSAKDGKTYLNLVSIKPVVANDQGGIDGDDVPI